MVQSMDMDNFALGAKEQLKASLASALLQGLTGERINKPAVSVDPNLSHLQIAKYLKERGLEFSLSVFLAETGVTIKDKQLKVDAKNLFPESTSLLWRDQNFTISQGGNDEAVVVIWEKFEEFYSEKLKSEVKRLGHLQQEKLRLAELNLQTKFDDEKLKLKDQYQNMIQVLREKEVELRKQASHSISKQEQDIQLHKMELLEQFRELEVARNDLKLLSDRFERYQESQKAQLKLRLEQSGFLENQLKKREAELNDRMHKAVTEAITSEQQKHARTLSEFSEKEQSLTNALADLNVKVAHIPALERSLEEKSLRIKELETVVAQQTTDLIRQKNRIELYQEKLGNFADRDSLFEQCNRLVSELENLRLQFAAQKMTFSSEKAALSIEIQNLNSRIAEVESESHEDYEVIKKDSETLRIELDRVKMELHRKQTEFQSRLEAEARSRELLRLLELQINASKDLSKLVPKQQRCEASRRRFTKAEDSSKSQDESKSTTDHSSDSTADFIKEARLRIKQLQIESENFDLFYRSYRQLHIPGASDSLRLSSVSDNSNSIRQPPRAQDTSFQVPFSSNSVMPEVQPAAVTVEIPYRNGGRSDVVGHVSHVTPAVDYKPVSLKVTHEPTFIRPDCSTVVNSESSSSTVLLPIVSEVVQKLSADKLSDMVLPIQQKQSSPEETNGVAPDLKLYMEKFMAAQSQQKLVAQDEVDPVGVVNKDTSDVSVGNASSSEFEW